MNTHPGGSTARAAAGIAALLTAGIAATALAACGAAPQEPAAEAPAPAPMQAGAAPHGAAPHGNGQQPGDGQQPGYPQPSAVPPAASRDDAVAELDRAELELNAALGSGPFAKPPAQPPPPTGTTAPGPKTPAEARGAERPSKAVGDPCATACRALASMRRAVDHLCGLAGDTDPRCGDARTRVKSATDRVRAQCSACGS
jgi:hypothetical protein